jgi:hypothetical protein
MRVELGAGSWQVVVQNGPHHGLDESRVVVDRLGDDEERAEFHALISAAGRPPNLLVIGRVRKSFAPGLHLVPETNTLFVGCAESIAIYDLVESKRKHLDVTPYTFTSWSRHDDVIVMCGELEVAAYDLLGSRRWAATIEPPWDFGVNGDTMFTIVMGHKTEFSLREGPKDSLVVSR